MAFDWKQFSQYEIGFYKKPIGKTKIENQFSSDELTELFFWCIHKKLFSKYNKKFTLSKRNFADSLVMGNC